MAGAPPALAPPASPARSCLDLLHPVEANGVSLGMSEAAVARLRGRGWHFDTFIGGGVRLMFIRDTGVDTMDALGADLRRPVAQATA
ncbi:MULTISPECIES: hypothetical protein [Methylobacteriaceae]|uniref:hypothetical protein n=1 Tax=Methylobacteriaceae TaxID=119045 RepID=UPI00074F98C2|nr:MULTISPECIES: hypothetical protein [Methylobacteriaceae]AMB43512.1 hypothetical protein Y590_01270 [Methylobacterium sp. AMS5]TFZ58837.1 hypothetical protein E4V01_09705 [Methylorubrum sp. Q1]